MVELLGSDPNKLFTLDDLKDEMKRCGNYALLMGPIAMQFSLADSVPNLDEMFNKTAEGSNAHTDLITGLNDKAQLQFDQRLNDFLEDILRLGYYRKANQH